MASKLHQKHPRCGCGRPLFKSFVKGGRVGASDPYRYCRNSRCPVYGDQGVQVSSVPLAQPTSVSPDDTLAIVTPQPERVEAIGGEPVAPPSSRAKFSRVRATAKAHAKTSVVKQEPKAEPKDVEPPSIARARKRIRELVDYASSGAPANSVGLVLALLSQETGNKASANQLIREHKLDELFGLQPQ